MAKITKEMWDQACAIENKIALLKGFVQNPVELTHEDVSNFNYEVSDIIDSLRALQRDVNITLMKV
jgi:hypothetical protein